MLWIQLCLILYCIEYEKKNGTPAEEFQHRMAVEVLNDAIEIVRRGGVE